MTPAKLAEIEARRSTRTFSIGEHNEICERLPRHFGTRVSLELDLYEDDIAALLQALRGILERMEEKHIIALWSDGHSRLTAKAIRAYVLGEEG